MVNQQQRDCPHHPMRGGGTAARREALVRQEGHRPVAADASIWRKRELAAVGDSSGRELDEVQLLLAVRGDQRGQQYVATCRWLQREGDSEVEHGERCLDLSPTIVALMQWGDAHAHHDAGPPVVLEHRGCGGAVDAHRVCARCGERLGARDVWATAGPGATDAHPLRQRLRRGEGATPSSRRLAV